MSTTPASTLAILNQPSRHAPASLDGAAPLRLVDPDAVHIGVRDLGITRGDGIFETIGAVSGTPQALEAHLRRFARSAAALDLPEPDLDTWRAAITAVADSLAGHREAAIKTIYTRGIEGDGRPTGWVHGFASSDFAAARRDGLRVVTLDRGYRHDVASISPWLLQGAKTLSYAVNSAALREAQRRGADDVIFVSSDGVVLEGPTSTVLLLRDGRLVTPGPGLAILDGTTQDSLFAFAAQHGIPTALELTTTEHLHSADAVWLVSSVRHAAPVTAVDGTPRASEADLTAQFNRYLAGRRD
ncbi:4-amino-4-deoxychorismate lyase [Marisediminicola sp. UYEF4]|uniref:aminodeoxychorismate lyase n=1 Tax=Marisediminicola sp. UYEF4 TaxID=1756384 RepID=UPI003396BC0F